MTTLEQRVRKFVSEKQKRERLETRFTQLERGFRALLEHHKISEGEPLTYTYLNDELGENVTVYVTNTRISPRNSNESVDVEIVVGAHVEEEIESEVEESESEQRENYSEMYSFRLGGIRFVSSGEERHPLNFNDPDIDDHINQLQFILSIGQSLATEW